MSNPDDADPGTVLDRPTYHDFLVDFGTFVVVSFDPVASVAALKDSRATELAAQLPRAKYLALVRDAINDSITWTVPPRQPPLALMFYLVGQQPRPAPQSSAYVALFSPHSHPTGRPSIIPDPPVPWPEVYVYTTGDTDARITRIHTDNPLPSRLSDGQMLQILKAGREDRATLASTTPDQDMTTAPSGGPVATSEGVIPTSSTAPAASDFVEEASSTGGSRGGRHVKDNVDILLGVGQSSSSDSEDSSSDSSSSKGSDGFGIEPFAMRLHAEVWLDVTTTTEFGDPSEVPALLAQLHEIEEEWQARETQAMLADQPRTRAWVQGVAEAGATAPEEPESSAVERVPSPPLDAPSEAGRAAVTIVDSSQAPQPADAPGKERRALFKLLARIVEVPRRFMAKVIALLPFQRKSKAKTPAEPAPLPP